MQKLIENKYLISILKFIQFLTIIPHKCLRTIVRSFVKLSNYRRFLLSCHTRSKQHYSCEYGSIKYYVYCGISGMLSGAITHAAVVPL
ncbi:unnamed protein product, partial [Rotaria sordida]